MRIRLTQPSTDAEQVAPVEDASDDHALALAARTDRAAFATLYRRYVARVYRYAYAHTGSRQDAEDVTTQVFLEALRGIVGFRGDGAFPAWLLSIARHKVLDWHRGHRDEVALDDSDATQQIAPVGIDDVIGARLRGAALLRALLTLGNEQRDAITLRYFAELSFAEVGRVMRKSEPAAKMLVQRGLKTLRETLPLEVRDA